MGEPRTRFKCSKERGHPRAWIVGLGSLFFVGLFGHGFSAVAASSWMLLVGVAIVVATFVAYVVDEAR